MPAKSEKQLKLIWAIRRKYGKRKNAPKKWKWVFGEEWGHLAKESHILNFNQFEIFESLDETKLWEEITKNEWSKKYLSRKSESFTESEILNIKELLSNGQIVDSKLNRIFIQLIASNAHIYKFHDEWYLVEESWPNGCTYWEADTFEGLVQLIKYIDESYGNFIK